MEPTTRQLYDAAYAHVSHVLNDIGQRTGYRWPALRVQFKNNVQTCHYRWTKTGKSDLVLGGKTIRHVMEYGYQEYERLSWIVPPYRYKGVHGFYYVVTHELAHYVHFSKYLSGYALYTKPHDKHFVRFYLELLHDYPFEAMRRFYAQLEPVLEYA